MTTRSTIIESTVIRLCAVWEAFVEEEMIDCLNIDSSKCREELQLKLPSHMTKDLCEAILLGRRYLDFRSLGDIKGTAGQVLSEMVNPFRLIKSNPTGKRIDELYAMRNYLSHYSNMSRRRLHKIYRDSWGLKRFQEPGDFLISSSGKRLFLYLNVFLDASRQMRRII